MSKTSTKAPVRTAETYNMPRPTVVAIIGSTKYKEYHLGVAQRETLGGKIVLLTGFYHHTDKLPITDTQKKQIDDLSKHKILVADEVVVVNVNGYIGETTRALIKFAEEAGKSISYLYPTHG